MITRHRFGVRHLRQLLAGGIIAAGVAFIIGIGQPALAAAGTFTQYTYSGPAGSRPYYVYTPAGYTTASRVPLIVMLHGCTQDPVVFANLTRINDLADANHFIVVYPQETAAYDPNLCWHWYAPADNVRGSGEPSILAGITQTVMADTANWNIDSHRVYIAGFSAGAAMTVVMGATYPDLFAAIGEESGLEYGTNNSDLVLGGPDPKQQGQLAYAAMGAFARVVPVIVFHGTNDEIVFPINGDQVVQQWMQTDHLASPTTYNPLFEAPSNTQVGAVPGLSGHPYSIRSWNDISGREIQEYWSVADMGHAWSGGSTAGTFADPNGPSATNNMYAFFMAHPN